MSSPIVYFQITSADPAASQSFYEQVFGWELEDADAGGRIAIDPGGPGDFDPKGSLSALRGDDGPAVTLFVRVEDLWASVERAEALDAKLLMPIRQIVEGGAHVAIIRAPDGLAFGLIQA